MAEDWLTAVLTRACYGPEWSLEANRRRLELFRGITVASLVAQTRRPRLFVLLVDPTDPLLAERIAVARRLEYEGNIDGERTSVRVVMWDRPEKVELAAWDKNSWSSNAERAQKNRVAATAYRAPWRDALRWDGGALTTRLDDDDALRRDALERVYSAHRPSERRRAYMLPWGFRVFRGRYAKIRHDKNAMSTLWTPPGDRGVIYDVPHVKMRLQVETHDVDDEPGWLWCRHPDTISGWRGTERPFNSHLRAQFPEVDWSLLR